MMATGFGLNKNQTERILGATGNRYFNILERATLS